MTLAEFEKKANEATKKALGDSLAPPSSEIERMYWEEMGSDKEMEVEYGADLEGSAFSTSPDDPLGRSDWNLKVRLLNSTPPPHFPPLHVLTRYLLLPRFFLDSVSPCYATRPSPSLA